MLIVIEGVAGAGKTKLLKKIEAALPPSKNGRSAVGIEFPTYGRVGQIIRSTANANYMGQLPRALEPAALLHLHLADLYDEMPRWADRLDAGDHVICERYIVSLRVHQIDHHSPYMVHNACRKAEATLPVPDLYVIINTPPEVALENLRLRSRPGVQLTDIDHMQVWAMRYLQVAGALGSWMPNGEQSVLLLNGEASTSAQSSVVLARMTELEQADRAA